MNNHTEKCPKCSKLMNDLGNDGHLYLTSPPQYKSIFVCHKCKIKKNVVMYCEGWSSRIDPVINDYEQINE